MTFPSYITRLRRTFAVVLAGLALTAVGGWALLSLDHVAAENDLQARAQVHARILEARFSDLTQPIRSAADFLAADREHNAAEFARFTNFAASHAGLLRWLAWAPLVTKAERAGFEAGMARIYPGFRIVDRQDGKRVPAPPRAAYFPLSAAQSLQGERIPLGRDIVGEPTLRTAAERARDEARAIASVPISGLAGDTVDQVIVLVAPVYADSKAPWQGVPARRRMLVGYVAGAYGLDATLGFLTSSVARNGEAISFAQPLPTASFGQAMAGPEGTDIAAGGTPLPPPIRGEYRVREPVSFSGQKWMATIAFTASAVARRTSYAPFGWVGAGLLLTTALGTMTARSESQRQVTERLVATRTKQLSVVNEHLRQSAETLQATLAAAPSGIIAVDVDANIVLWNNGAERIFGYKEAEVLGKRTFGLLVPDAALDEAYALFERARGGALLRDIELQYRRSDGALVDVRLAANPLRDAEGRIRGVVSAIQDITDSRRLEEQLRQAQKMEAIGQLTGGVAHDFNNLLGTAITGLDLLLDRLPNGGEEKELTRDALDALLHGADLVRRLLAFSRRQPLQPERVRLNAAVLETVRLVRPLLGNAITIALELSDEQWSVLVDRGQFETSLINLATNARDAMPYGGQLTITTRNIAVTPEQPVRNPELPPGDYVAVEVRDTGTGMPPALLQRIFEPFFTTKGKSVGTGLGLSSVLGFIQQSGGYIGVDSEEGVGSGFRLYLSRHVDDTTDAALAVPTSLALRLPPSRGEQVLVVEDNQGLRHVVLQQLRKFGYHVIEAADAVSAMAILEGGRHVDLLFTDVMLPAGMSGLQLAELARKRWPELKVLLTSGFPEVLLEQPAAVAHLRLIGKPYREEELAHVLREVLAG